MKHRRSVKKKARKAAIVETVCEDCSSVWSAYYHRPPKTCAVCGGDIKITKVIVK